MLKIEKGHMGGSGRKPHAVVLEIKSLIFDIWACAQPMVGTPGHGSMHQRVKGSIPSCWH